MFLPKVGAQAGVKKWHTVHNCHSMPTALLFRWLQTLAKACIGIDNVRVYPCTATFQARLVSWCKLHVICKQYSDALASNTFDLI